MKIRHEARIVALQALFEMDCVGHQSAAALEQRLAEMPLPEQGIQFARELVQGVTDDIAKLDKLIERYAPEWPVEQIAIIDRNILRIAIYEVLSCDGTPLKVAINEAVELAKQFGSDSSGRFVNGVLGSLVAKEEIPGKR
jgi:N utilization substance protein B